jgi:hypothetical protein
LPSVGKNQKQLPEEGEPKTSRILTKVGFGWTKWYSKYNKARTGA